MALAATAPSALLTQYRGFLVAGGWLLVERQEGDVEVEVERRHFGLR
ncbi:MAG: hypothetical protein ACLQFR_02105 [Streptosporangiaceae bacterium]